ncbi:hypothetical protein Q7C36_003819 [Tachysurus vachellii]|uniref:RRM domain-containing protein n=1 Tax=Tachysurus vachellii TaxID=175792 RepID=A0AA88NWZ6_TACVA|nr:hypothetical protein Q7C36_003819 [Tachysurus vachellii]
MLLKGRQITVEYFKSREERKAEDKNQGNNLYIKNLDDSVDKDCLYRTFAQFGTIKSAKVMMENGRSKGFGFVCFTSSQDAMKAMNVMNGMMWGKKKIYVGLAQKKVERRLSYRECSGRSSAVLLSRRLALKTLSKLLRQLPQNTSWRLWRQLPQWTL